MGMDPEGLLFWGFSLGSKEEMEDGLPWEPDDETEVDVEELIAEAAGITKVTAGDGDFNEWYSVPANKAAIQAYWEAKKQAKADIGAEVTTTGTSDFPGYAIIATTSEQKVEWAEHREVDLTVNPLWQDCLDRLCAILGIESQPGRWLLACSYG